LQLGFDVHASLQTFTDASGEMLPTVLPSTATSALSVYITSRECVGAACPLNHVLHLRVLCELLLVELASDMLTTLLFIQHPLGPDWQTAKLLQLGFDVHASLQAFTDVSGEMLPTVLPSTATRALSVYITWQELQSTCCPSS
jgi:hypothetical protein